MSSLERKKSVCVLEGLLENAFSLICLIGGTAFDATDGMVLYGGCEDSNPIPLIEAADPGRQFKLESGRTIFKLATLGDRAFRGSRYLILICFLTRRNRYPPPIKPRTATTLTITIPIKATFDSGWSEVFELLVVVGTNGRLFG